MDVSLSDLRYFLKISEMGNISKAAQKLGLRQSTLSGSLKRMEAALGANIFIRTKHGVRLTRQGEGLIKSVRELEAMWAGLKASGQDTNEVSGKLVLGCHSLPATYYVPRLYQALRERFPLLELHLVHEESHVLNGLVERGEVDFALSSTTPVSANLVVTPVVKERMGFCGASPRITPEKSVLFYVPSFPYAEILLNMLSKRRLRFREAVVCTSFEVCAAMAAQEGHVAILPDTMKGTRLHMASNLPATEAWRSLIYHTELQRAPGRKLIARAIRECLKEL